MHFRHILITSCLLASPALSGGAGAQSSPLATPDRTGPVRAPAVASEVLLDRPVDRREYRLGPGDVVGVSVFGEQSLYSSVQVSPEGTIVIPNVGVATVLGLRLDEAEARVRTLVARLYRVQEVRLTLETVRAFRVSLTGDVDQRGVRSANAASRATELLGAMNGMRAWRRNVMLRRVNGDSLRLDFARFALTGDLTRNPTLREGDELFVPVADRTVTLHGPFAFPGVYEYVAGESLADLVQLANAGQGFRSEAAATVRLSRYREGERRDLIELSREEVTGARGRALVLQPFDVVFVAARANVRSEGIAEVRGQVRFPGTYPIRADTTTVRELIELAGGLTPYSSVALATLERMPANRSRAIRELEVRPDSSLDREERQARNIAAQNISGTFVVVDFSSLMSADSASANPVLQNGDVLTIPTRRDEVTVLGAVVRPGIVRYRPGMRARDYVESAGGYSRRADRSETSVVKAAAGNRLAADEAGEPGPGDQIVVPFKVSRTLLERLQLVSGVVSTISGIVLTAYAVSRF